MKITLTLLPEECLALAELVEVGLASGQLTGPGSTTAARVAEYVAAKARHQVAMTGVAVPSPTTDDRTCEACKKPGAVRYTGTDGLPPGTHHARCRAALWDNLRAAGKTP